MNPTRSRPSFSLCAALICGLVLPALAAAQQPPPGQAPEKSQTTAATQEEVNAATKAMGAEDANVAGQTIGLDAVLQEAPDAKAQLVPGKAGQAVSVIDLAGTVVLSRVAIEVGPAKGRLVLVGMNERGEQIDLGSTEDAGKVIADQKLDGTQATFSFDVSKLTVKAVMICWVPDEPGRPLTMTKVGIFTKETIVPDVDRVAVAVPDPVLPPAEVVAALRSPGELVAAAKAPEQKPAMPRQASLPQLPDAVPPQARPVSF